MARTRIISAAVVLVVGLLAVWVGTAVRGDHDGTVDGPVIAVSGWDAYPTAEIGGELRLVEGCLLLGGSVVFWADGTSWDAASQAVVFESADPVAVGAGFSGGGGHYSRGDLEGLEGVDADAVEECLRRTGAGDAVIAVPSR